MCKSKMSVDAAQPVSTPRRTLRTQQSTQSTHPTSAAAASSYFEQPSTSNTHSGGHNTSTTSYKLSSSTSSSTSFSNLKDSLPVPENPIVYDFSELCAATNNFLSKRLTDTSTLSWRCKLRGKDAVVFQRKFRVKLSAAELKNRLSTLCRSHHTSIIKLLGACISTDHTFLVYEFVHGASLAACLRNPNNPNFTVLSTWTSRMQIATDLAQGLDYIHNNTGLNVNLVHNHITSGSVLVTEPHYNGRICHFGAAQLCGETDSYTRQNSNPRPGDQIEGPTSRLSRSDSRKNQFEGVRGYMSPEFQTTGAATQKSDVYAFGIVILELLSAQEPFKYKFDKTRGDFIRTSVVDSGQAAVLRGGLRTWVDNRLQDSFPVEVAEKLTRLALECVHVDPDQRPSMERVSGKISKLYLESKFWSDNVRVPAGISVSLAPR
ncbi:hypothetical protein TB2_029276 [Malus domestica]|uniref:lysM domain receptor-like kinase 3 n=1 Tax=Malus domestica TaxID=3750 RepID=UPI003975F321